MTQQGNKRLLHIFLVWFLLLFLWGCAHGGREQAVHDEPVPPTAAPVDRVQEDEAQAGAPVDDDPFFTDEEDYWDEGGDTEDDFFGEEDDLFLESEVLIADPLQPFNRAMFTVNDKLYFWMLKPVAQGYRFVMPTIARKGIRNVFKNLGMPVRFVSSLFQAKFKGAGTELARFVVNTTVGIGGIWDPAERYLHLQASDEDLGQAFGKWGIGNGVYIVWPFFGPSTIRDTVGKVGDFFLNPIYYMDLDSEVAIALEAVDVVNNTSLRLGDYEAVKQASMDPYVMIRDFYVEFRKKQIAE